MELALNDTLVPAWPNLLNLQIVPTTGAKYSNAQDLWVTIPHAKDGIKSGRELLSFEVLGSLLKE